MQLLCWPPICSALHKAAGFALSAPVVSRAARFSFPFPGVLQKRRKLWGEDARAQPGQLPLLPLAPPDTAMLQMQMLLLGQARLQDACVRLFIWRVTAVLLRKANVQTDSVHLGPLTRRRHAEGMSPAPGHRPGRGLRAHAEQWRSQSSLERTVRCFS